MTELAFAPAHAIAAAVRRRDVSPLEVVDAALDRIEALNPHLNAFVALRADQARDEARALGERITRGEDPGPLAGVPFGVKDLEDLAGLPTTYGSMPYRSNVATHDSTQVARLKRAGAIALGKTNTPEFGSTAFTKNLVFGTSRNPWNLERTPGGSSGGSSAAIAAGLVPLSTASDGGGSIRIPASYVGAFGLKPTFGRVPRGPFEWQGWIDTAVYGPLTRCVQDAALFLDAVVGRDARDPDSLPHPGHRFQDGLDDLPKGLRIAYSSTLGYARVDCDVRREVEAGVALLGQTLGRPVDLLSDRLTDAGPAWAFLNSFETYAHLAPMIEEHRELWGRGFLRGVEQGARFNAADIGGFQRTRIKLMNEVAGVFERFDLLLTPTLPTTAFPATGPMPSGADGEPFASPIHAVAFTYPFNLTGHPACTVRAGLGDDGLPVGLQIVAERGQEHLLLKVARAWERVRPFEPWPRLPA